MANTSESDKKKVLIVGLGISGIASAIALKQAGREPTVVEKAPERRKGGYFIGLFGMGRYGAEHLGALDKLHDRRGADAVNYSADRTGITGDTLGFADAPRGFGPWMMLRGDVEEALFNSLPEDIEIRFDTHPVEIWQNASGVRVSLENSETGEQTEETYDLLVGADGIHSQVREMVFGPAKRFMNPLNCMICAFTLPENPPGLGPDEGLMLAEPGKSFWVFPFTDHPATVLFTYATDDPQQERQREPKARLREVFGPAPYGDYMGYALDVLDEADEFIFDTTDQVTMDTWHQGRVVLLGDSAWCPTLYSGMGATSGIGGADLLGAALRKYPDDLDGALAHWEQILRPKIAEFQKMGASVGRRNFVSRTQKELDTRNRLAAIGRKLIHIPATTQIVRRSALMRHRTDDLTREL